MPRKERSIHPPVRAAHLKPTRFKDYLTLGELGREVDKDTSWLRKLERKDRIPKPIRHEIGGISIRLYSPAKVREIKQILSTLKRGRPKAS